MKEQERLDVAQKMIMELINKEQHRAEMLEDDASHDANSNSKFYKRAQAGIYRDVFHDLCRILDVVRG